MIHCLFLSLYLLFSWVFVFVLIQETEKFSAHLHKKLSKKDIFGDSVDEVVGICTEVFPNPS